MKNIKIYYHGTTPDNANLILKNGFELTNNDVSNFKGIRNYNGQCLYAFTNLNDAIDFICNQGHNEQSVIAFNVSDDTGVINDNEYDEHAYILFGEFFDTSNEKIVWEQAL